MQVHFTPERRTRTYEFLGSRDGRVTLAAIATAWMLFGLALGSAVGLGFIVLGVMTAVACLVNDRIVAVLQRIER